MKFPKEAVLAGTALVMLSSFMACAPSEVDRYREPSEVDRYREPSEVDRYREPSEVERYCEQLNLPPQDRAIVGQLGYDANTIALLDEISYFPEEIQIDERVLYCLKNIAADGIVTSNELSDFRDVDTDGLTNRDELERGTNVLHPDTDKDGLSDREEVLNYKTDPLNPNPTVRYGLDSDRSFFIPWLSLLEAFDKDGKMDDNERQFLDILPTYPDTCIENLIRVSFDGRVTGDELKALNYLSKQSEHTRRYYLDFAFSDAIASFLALLPNLPNQDFAQYALENKLTIQDSQLTDLEKKFLQNPDSYINDVFDYYLAEIAKTNSELSSELAKLPDFEQIELEDVEAVEDILVLVLAKSCFSYKVQSLVSGSEYQSFINFQAVLTQGIKEERRYCTPLQALIWLAYDRETFWYSSTSELIKDAWQQSTTSQNFSSDKWRNFEEVVHRLNSPAAVAWYMDLKLVYDIWSWNAPYVQEAYFHKARYTFIVGRGVCSSFGNFGAYCLQENGYEAYHLRAGQENPKPKVIQGRTVHCTSHVGHSVALYKEGESFYFIDGPFPEPAGWESWSVKIRGPFATVEEAAKGLCDEHDFLFEWHSLFKPK